MKTMKVLLLLVSFFAATVLFADDTNDVKAEIVWQKDEAKMRLMPAGAFAMGTSDAEMDRLVKAFSDDGAKREWFVTETPRHTVEVSAFYIDVHEVTVGQYRKFVAATGHPPPDWSKVSEYAPTTDHPVIFVSWFDAMAYATWAGKRLPTEAEWEYAARGGLVGKAFPWGDAIDATKANHGQQVGRTSPVRSYPANGLGLYDMAGNVWEWCLDAYEKDFYRHSPKKNPFAGGVLHEVVKNLTKVDKNKVRVIRGGSWYSHQGPLRVASRGNYYPPYAMYNIGFRCVKPVDEVERKSK